MIAIAIGPLLTSIFFDTPLDWEPDALMKGGGDYPHVMDPRLSKDDVVGSWAVQHTKGYMEVHSIDVDWKSDISLGELLLPTESGEDARVGVDVGLFILHSSFPLEPLEKTC